jgi:hypothetical protein
MIPGLIPIRDSGLAHSLPGGIPLLLPPLAEGQV